MTEICLSIGHRGGHIFPFIFSGSCLAYGLSKLFSIDPVLCLSIIVTGIASKATAIGKMINNIEIKVLKNKS